MVMGSAVSAHSLSCCLRHWRQEQKDLLKEMAETPRGLQVLLDVQRLLGEVSAGILKDTHRCVGKESGETGSVKLFQLR